MIGRGRVCDNKMADAPLVVEIARGRLVISIGVNALGYAVTAGEQGLRVTDATLAAANILRELQREEEDGTTPVHKMLDKAALDAWEHGGEGFESVEGDR